MEAGHVPDVLTHLREILILLAVAGILVPLFQRFRVSPIFGYLLCGIAIGPFGLGEVSIRQPWLLPFTIQDQALVGILAELGVIFLLFTIGLELSLRRLWDMRKLVLGVGSLQIILTGLTIAIIAYLFGNPPILSLLLGACFALSSTAMTMQILKDQHRLSTPIGRLSFSVLLMQDLAVVPILVLLPMLVSDGVSSVAGELGKALLMASTIIAMMFAIGHWLLRPIFATLGAARKPECFFALVLFVVIGAAALTHSVGLSAAFGAFLAGLLIAETEYRHEVDILIEPVKGLLLGVFFLSVGMQTDLAAFLLYPGWIVASVAGLLVIKSSVFFLLSRAFGLPLAKAAESSLLLGHAGEFALMILSLAGPLGLISRESQQFFLLLTTLSMLSTPAVAMFARKLGIRFQQRGSGLPEWLAGGTEARPENHVIIAGFGRVGVMLAAILEQEGYRYVAIDRDAERTRRYRDMGYPVYYGDARRLELWSRLSADRAAAVLITVDEAKAADEMLRVLRHEWPLLPVVIRAHDVADMPKLYEDGATLVVPEMMEASLQIARHLLLTLGAPESQVDASLAHHRQAHVSAPEPMWQALPEH